MFRFDSRNRKPDVWNIAVLSGILMIVLCILYYSGYYSFYLFSCLFTVYLIMVIVLLVRALIQQLEYNPYSYNTIFYSGFALFAFYFLSAMGLLIYRIRSYGFAADYGFFSLFGRLLEMPKTFMIVSFPLITVFAGGLCASNISLIRHEGRSVRNILGMILSGLLIGGVLFLFFTDDYVAGSQTEVMRHELLINLYAAVYLYFECMMIGTIIANVIVTGYEPSKDKDFIIVLGSGLMADGTPTPLLAGRIERALKFYHDQLFETRKAPVFITSGGQGSDEVNSESEAMRRYLIAKGIPADQIIQENRSTDTYENMLFSKQIIDQIRPDAKVIYSTTNYHVFRSGLWARRVKMRAQGIGSATRWYFWPNAMVREFVGLLSEHRLKQALILGGMIAVYLLATYATYQM